MINSAPSPDTVAGGGRSDISRRLHDLRTPLNQIIGLSEMLMEIAEEDGRSDLMPGLAGLREGGVELAGVLEDKRIVEAGGEYREGFLSLADATRGATERVLRLVSEIVSSGASPLPGEYRSDLNKIRHAAQRFAELAGACGLVIPSFAVITTSSAPVANRGYATRSGTLESRVLIVDDEDLNVEVLCRRLQREGYRPTGVSSGKAAIELLRSSEFDAVLLDLLMPVMSGIDVLQILKHDPHLRHVPVIMLSALSDVERIAQCIELGAEDYLPKPINSTLLRARLGACLEKKQLRDKEQAYFRAIHAEKERLSVTLRSLADAVITTDEAGRITVCNDVAVTLAMVDRDGIVGRLFPDVFRIVHRSTGHPIACPVAETLARNAPFDCEAGISMRSADGSERLVSVRSAPMHDHEGAVVGSVIVIRDITERERMAEEIQRASKLQSIGFLAGGLAHHYNNMLTAVLGNLSLLPHRWVMPPEAMMLLREAEQGASRAKELTRYLLTFADGGAPIREVLPLRRLLEDTCGPATRESHVECFFHLPPDLLEIEVDQGQMAQAFDGIISNAVDAMPDGGIVCVDAENVIAPLDSSPPLAPGSYVRVRIQDHGCGIRPNDLPHVCDPFFTTKESARGLGLAVAYSIIQRHGGQLLIESTVGCGTTVSCYLPARMTGDGDSAPANVVPVESASGNKPGGSATRPQRVLVMDDEEAIRLVAEAMLTTLDYEVVTTACGEDALVAHAEALAAGKPFDFVIMDLRIPGGMGGGEAMLRIREKDPAIRAIVASGYSDDPVMADFARYGFNGVLPKPYLMDDLGRVMTMVAPAR